MKHIVFVIKYENYFRFIDGIIHELLISGAKVTVVCGADDLSPSMQHFLNNHSGFDFEFQLVPIKDLRGYSTDFLTLIRKLRSYRHWMRKDIRRSPSMRRRDMQTFPSFIRRLVKLSPNLFDAILYRLPALSSLFRWIEESTPPNHLATKHTNNLRPDIVICSPVVTASHFEVEYMKAAKKQGIPTVAFIATWDNLTTKRIFNIEPDYVMVWNEIQHGELIRYHQIPEEKIRVCGAATFDHWFTDDYKIPRQEFLEQVGFAPDSRYILYVGSSSIVKEDKDILLDLISELHKNISTRKIKVIVRPHPTARIDKDILTPEGVVIWPPTTSFPDTKDQRLVYFNSLYHAEAVIGISTSAFVEAALLDRPCISLDLSFVQKYLHDMPHFQYLIDSDIVYLPKTIPDCVATISDILSGEDRLKEARHRFLTFVRPIQDGRTASQINADVIWSIIQ